MASGRSRAISASGGEHVTRRFPEPGLEVVAAAPGWSWTAAERTSHDGLSEIQTLILSATSQRGDGNLLPLPGSLRGGATAKVVTALLTRGLADETITDDMRAADTALNRVWRNTDDGRAVLLRITGCAPRAVKVHHSPSWSHQ